ncbi:M15 family metallopeptidase [Bosea sp. (in: a-proteobacteria)]|uniref:M15 family metallopeptidase n=1 Tax=Bosea sp. (in: a-proteobacteria) TaxID=1871050 RepID=UPI003442D2E7
MGEAAGYRRSRPHLPSRHRQGRSRREGLYRRQFEPFARFHRRCRPRPRRRTGNSNHSRGSTVDVGLVRAGEAALPTPADAGPCDGPLGIRPPESSLDLGTSFDCFSEKSALRHPGVTAEARRNRDILAAAMAAEGFRGYGKEWWHFTLVKEPFPKTSFDFAIE